MLPELVRLFDDPLVTDVAVGLGSASVREGGRWRQLESSQIDWLQRLNLEEVCIDLVEGAGGRLDYRVPMATVVAGDFRAHAVLGSAFGSQPSLTLRRLSSSNPFICADLATQTSYWRLKDCLLSRKSVLIAGPAGSGKTTLLRSLLNELGDERVITIEDARELQLASANTVSLVTRTANVEGQGEITLTHLLVEALRMSPDRIAVGEVRGPELVTMLDALNTGHSGAGATIHANSLASVSSRLTAIAARAGVSHEALALQVLDAFELVAYLGRDHRISAVGKFALSGERLVVDEFAV